MKDKKGLSLDSLYPAVLTIILVGIILGIGIYVLGETSRAISTTTITVKAETLTTVSETGETVNYAGDCGFHDMTILTAMNATNGTVIPANNYSYDPDSGVIRVNGPLWNNTNWVVNYTYLGTNNTASTGPCGVMTTTATGVGGLASWIAIIVVVLAAAIVLGVVVGSFGNRSSA